MITLLIILAVIILAGGSTDYMLVQAKKENTKALMGPKLSPPSKQLLKEYNSLPADSRPFPDITSVLVALDRSTDHIAEKRRRHFDDNWLPNIAKQSGGLDFNWKPHRQSCSHQKDRWDNCPFYEYWNLHNDIQEVKDVLLRREEAERQAEFASHRETIKELKTRLREESRLQEDVIRELRKLSR